MAFDNEPVEQVVKPDRIGSMDKEILRYKPPSGARKKVMGRVFQMWLWVERKGWVEREELIVYAMNRWDVERETALEYTKEVIDLMNRQGKVRG